MYTEIEMTNNRVSVKNKNKTVTFAEDVKDFDGSSSKILPHFLLVGGYDVQQLGLLRKRSTGFYSSLDQLKMKSWKHNCKR